MNKNIKKKKTYTNYKLPAKIILVLGIIFILVGSFLVVFSFLDEVLEDKYIVKTATNYKPEKIKNLDKGEISITKNIKYIRNGIYKITYKNYTNKNSKNILEDNTNLYIVDTYNPSYILEDKSIIVNGNKLSLNEVSKINNIEIKYSNNTLTISIPSSEINKKNTIEVKIKLTLRDTNIKHNISKETYYSFTPNIENDFYNKKITQAYVIEGNGYIKLEEK